MDILNYKEETLVLDEAMIKVSVKDKKGKTHTTKTRDLRGATHALLIHYGKIPPVSKGLRHKGDRDKPKPSETDIYLGEPSELTKTANKLKRKEGYIYMWATELSVNDKNFGIPRAYKLKYTRKNHKQVAAALLRLGDGILQKGEKVEAKEDIDIEEDLSNLQDFVIYDLPKPLLPQKSREGIQAGETKKGFDAIESDPKTGKPLEKKEGLKE